MLFCSLSSGGGSSSGGIVGSGGGIVGGGGGGSSGVVGAEVNHDEGCRSTGVVLKWVVTLPWGVRKDGMMGCGERIWDERIIDERAGWEGMW